jgi:hypothetical protein
LLLRGLRAEAKPRCLVTEISLADDFQCHGAAQIDIEGFVSDAHCAPTQLDRFPVFALHQFVMLKAMRSPLRRRINRFLESRRLAGLNSTTKTFAKHTDGQNSITPESSLPQVGQIRFGSVLMGLCAFNRNLSQKQNHAPLVCPVRWRAIVQFHKQLRVSWTVADEVDFRNKIPADRFFGLPQAAAY